MIRPSKHSHPDQTVMAAAAVILPELKRRRVMSFGDLKAVLEKSSKGSDFLFTPSVSVLYLLGVLEYRATTDLFEYVSKP